MRVLIAIGLVAGILVLASDAQAVTCDQRAALCMKNGGIKSKCYGPAVESCKRTCVYVGYGTGKKHPASGDCKKG